jgi:serine protease Do
MDEGGDSMRAAMKFTLAAIAAVAVVGAVLVCRPSETPAASDKDPRIWTEGSPAAEAPAVPSGFNPMKGFSELVKKVQPAVVNINTTTVVKGQRSFQRRGPRGMPDDFFGDDLFRHFFGDQMEVPPQKRNSLGSGFIINPEGYILTNNHVVSGATEIMVKLAEGKEYKAKLVGKGDERYDLALLKIDPGKDRLPFLAFGDSDTLEVGDWVVAIGSPFGLAKTVTAGIVSAKDRVIGAGPLDDFIQTDASINPGNSGGPLFDATGLVVGINTAIHAAGQGIGFAVPVNMAKVFVRDVMSKGRVSRGWLGVGIQPLNAELAKGLGLATTSGVLVSQVFPKSPAEKAGFKRGDVIVAVNGKRVDEPADLTRVIGITSPGDEAKVKVVRDGKETTLTAKISEQDGSAVAAGGGPGESGPEAASLGVKVRAPTAKEVEKLGLPEGQGVIVDDVDQDGPAAETGVRPGDAILEVNRQPVASVADYAAAIAKVPSGDSVMVLLLRGDRYFYVVVKKP